MPSGFTINRHAIAEMVGEIQREFDKHPIRVPIEADDPDVTEIHAAHHTTYNGPVINIQGDRAQVAWNNSTVHQAQGSSAEIAPGYEAIASRRQHAGTAIGGRTR